ncbi:Uncharacterized protein dnm_048080 [Desulfonema magnum]|uniref:Uncharacterized protein n=1 Tax=Desulfonema magnum TaxID=45655 RepID=A0A975BNK2_9BACT|nr:Uncharacterized protein dnm_048080 [Desulfonema magnum]
MGKFPDCEETRLFSRMRSLFRLEKPGFLRRLSRWESFRTVKKPGFFPGCGASSGSKNPGFSAVSADGKVSGL